MKKKRLAIGTDSFEKIRQMDLYYVDKTGLIKDLLDNMGEANLFTRPRRFGKSLNMSMLQSFFQIGTDPALFDGLEILKERKLCEEYMGQFPVISVSLKTAHGSDFRVARNQLCSIIGAEASRFYFLSDSDRLNENDKKLYQQFVHIDSSNQGIYAMSDTVLAASLKNLALLLEKHYGKKVIILIDEYDVPLAKADERGYYEEMILLIRNMLDSALKSNSSLYFAVLTGCLRVSKESIFTGLNNLKMFTLMDARCGEWFGFTDGEVRQMLNYYGLENYYTLTKEWYDGYQVGRVSVYNPWDVVNWCDQLLTDINKTPRSYWANSSGNLEVGRFIRSMGNGVTKSQVERLISGETVTKKIEEQLTYNTMYDSIENMWSLLFATGYLTRSGTPNGNILQLTIPNTEVRSLFTENILTLFKEDVKNDGELLANFCDALQNGKAEDVERLFNVYMGKTVSIRDTAVQTKYKENFYHGLLLGILGFKTAWDVESNREAGNGYDDISVEIEDEETGIVIEVKYARTGNLDAAAAEAMKQMNTKDYAAGLRRNGMRSVLKYGIGCYRNKCRVMVEKE